MIGEARDEVGAADDDACLWSSEQLVTGECHHVGTRFENLSDPRLSLQPSGRGSIQPWNVAVDEPAADIEGERDVACVYECDEVLDRRGFGEPDHPVVRWVNLEDEAGSILDRTFIVRQAGAVRRSNLEHAGARRRHQLGQAVGTTDLDQLPPRHGDWSVSTHGGERQQQCSRVVVDDEGGLRTGDIDHQPVEVDASTAPTTLRQIELEVPICDGCAVQSRGSGGSQRCSPEVGVQEHARCVDDRPMPERSKSFQHAGRKCQRVLRGAGTGLANGRPGRLDDEQTRECGVAQFSNELIHRGQIAKRHGVKRSFRGSYRVEAAYPSNMDDQPIRDASTVCVVKPGVGGLEVLMVRRATSSVFVGGAYVFPGGALDEVDRSDTARRLFGDGPLSPWLSAAVRETAEEAGLVVPTGPIETPRTAHGVELLRALDDAGYAFDRSRLAYLSNWVTPKGQPRRFDTRFFVTDAPEYAQASPDGTEVTDTVWVAPGDALEHRARGEWTLVPPTIATLETLAEFDDAAAVLAFAHRQESVPRFEPRVVRQEGTLKILMPGDAGYDEAEA